MNVNLHPKQYEAFTSPATEILYGGAAGGGKSYLMRMALIMWCATIPGLQCYLFRRTFPDLNKNHMEGPTSFPLLLADWIRMKLVTINWGDMCISFWNGSKIFLCHCQHEKNVYNYQGAEIHVLMIDELTHFTKFIYSYLRGRVRMTGIPLRPEDKDKFPRILAGSNPGGVGHNWVKAAFVDAAKPMDVWQTDAEDGGMLRQFIPAKMDDNPTLLIEDPKYLQRLEGLGDPALVKAMRDGDWNIVSGGMFDDLWRVDRHVWTPFKIPDSWRLDRAFDWGSSKPFSVGWWAESDGTPARLHDGSQRTFPRGSLFLVQEWYGWNGQSNEGLKMQSTEIAKGIVEREAFFKRPVLPGPADSSIFDAVDGRSIADEMAKAPHRIRWTLADKSPGSRKTGWQRIREMMEEARKDHPEGPIIGVFDHCRQWIRNVPALPRDERDTDDVDTDAEDHDGDMTRYRVMRPKHEQGVRTLSGM